MHPWCAKTFWWRWVCLSLLPRNLMYRCCIICLCNWCAVIMKHHTRWLSKHAASVKQGTSMISLQLSHQLWWVLILNIKQHSLHDSGVHLMPQNQWYKQQKYQASLFQCACVDSHYIFYCFPVFPEDGTLCRYSYTSRIPVRSGLPMVCYCRSSGWSYPRRERTGGEEDMHVYCYQSCHTSYVFNGDTSLFVMDHMVTWYFFKSILVSVCSVCAL